MNRDSCYTLVQLPSHSEAPNTQALKRNLERGTDEIKIETMQQIINCILNGETHEQLLMHIIRFVMPSKNKVLKKLLLFYWEICPKYNSDGKLKQEMILACNSLRSDLQHPNEYIRGATLRFLCKLRDPEILEPLVDSAIECLDHRHIYVRKNAVLALGSIYLHTPHLTPDLPERLHSFLESQDDMICKRNALSMLTAIAPDLAVKWLQKVAHQLLDFDELLQLAVIELIRKLVATTPGDKAKYIPIIFQFLSARANSVKYEAASTLINVTTKPAAVKEAAACYIDLVNLESDNNIKLIVLESLDQLRLKNKGVLDDLVMDLLRLLSSPDIEVRRKCLHIVMNLVSRRNIHDVVSLLKKELIKTYDSHYDQVSSYRLLLIQTIHSCAVHFPEIAADVVQVFLSSMGELNTSSAVDAITFVREVAEKFPDQRPDIITQLIGAFESMKPSKVVRGALWLFGEYAITESDIQEVWSKLRQAIGELPLLAAEQREHEQNTEAGASEGDSGSGSAPQPQLTTFTRILPDGTYATESSLSVTANAADTEKATIRTDNKPLLRALLLKGDFFIGSVLANTLAKLVFHLRQVPSIEVSKLNAYRAEAMLIMTGIIRLGQSKFVTYPIDEDSYDRILSCIRALEHIEDEDSGILASAFLEASEKAVANLISVEDSRQGKEKRENAEKVAAEVDEGISFNLLSKGSELEDVGPLDNEIVLATSEAGAQEPTSKLENIVQLTGFTDPVYAEAYVSVHQYDILLDILIVNQTDETLRDLSIDFATIGDLKLVERPRNYNIGPHSFSSVKANIKVSSTETGIIFGNIVYEGPGVGESHYIVLNDIHVDIMEYIKPGYCDERS
ncbi:coatomer subunit beta, partial [Spiromyces aspiralis]